jgi:hypothetical protein
MPQLDSSRGGLGKKKKSASPGSKRRAKGPQVHGVPLESKIDQTEPSLPTRGGKLERTRRLLLAALRVWELKRRIRD